MKIVVLYQPTFEFMNLSGEVETKTLTARDSFEEAEEDLKTHLIGRPGANGQIEKFYVCVDETVQVVNPDEPEQKLLLPRRCE